MLLLLQEAAIIAQSVGMSALLPGTLPGSFG